MYAENVEIYYNGVKFTVQVPCEPNTPKHILEARAIHILDKVFSQHGIRIA